MRNSLIVLALTLAVLAGCNWSQPLSLGEPRPIVQAPPDTAVDMLGRIGQAQDPRFDTPSYTGLQQNSFTEVGADFDPDVSPDGKVLVYASTRNSNTADVYIKRIEGQTVTRLTDDPANEIQPTLSPDGNYIAYAADRSGNWDIYVCTADGRKPFQVTNGPSHEVHPSWSPDGGRLCYSAFNSRNGQWEIWVVDVANPASRKFVTNGLFPVWGPGDAVNRIAFQQARQRGTQLFGIWTVDLVNDEARFPTEIVPASTDTAAIAPAWSPDGNYLVYTTVKLIPPQLDKRGKVVKPQRVEHGDDIWISSLDGKNRVRLTSDGLNNWSPMWGADERVYFVSNRSGCDNIWSLRPVDMKLIQATRGTSQRVGSVKSPGAAVVQLPDTGAPQDSDLDSAATTGQPGRQGHNVAAGTGPAAGTMPAGGAVPAGGPTSISGISPLPVVPQWSAPVQVASRAAVDAEATLPAAAAPATVSPSAPPTATPVPPASPRATDGGYNLLTVPTPLPSQSASPTTNGAPSAASPTTNNAPSAAPSAGSAGGPAAMGASAPAVGSTMPSPVASPTAPAPTVSTSHFGSSPAAGSAAVSTPGSAAGHASATGALPGTGSASASHGASQPAGPAPAASAAKAPSDHAAM